MPTVSETILQRVRAWAVAVLGVADDRVQLAARGAEPPLYPLPPCLILDLTDLGTKVGTTGRAYTPTATVQFAMYEGSLTLHAYGDEGSDWLHTLYALADSAGLVGLTLLARGDISDASQPTASGIESHFVCDMEVLYAVRVSTPPAVAAASIPVTFNNTPNTGAP